MFTQVIAVFLGGGFGSICRWLIALAGKHWLGSFPIHTLITNFMASFILGISIAYFSPILPKQTPFWFSFVAIGFCGGFSTFSTFSAETFALLQQGNIFFALLNIALSVIVCLLAIALGVGLVQFTR